MTEEDAVQISINDLLHYVEQTVLLLGQSSNAITYHRRLNVLGSVMNSQYQVKSMLKEKASLLQKHDEYLFGKKFRNHIADTIKSKKQTKEIFIEHKKPFSFSPSHAPRKCEGQKFFLTKTGSKKFHNGNQQQQQQRHTYYGQTGSQQQRYGRCNYSTANLLQHGFKSRKINSVGIKKGSPIDKKIILVNKYSRCSISRKIETFCRILDENNTGSQNFGHSKRIQNSISFKTFSIKNPFPSNSKSRRGRIGETGGKRNVEEGSHQKSSTIKRGVCKQLIPYKKEGWRQKTSDKVEATECIYPILPLQNRRFAKS